ncbi:hypothetical protein CgunFtcFv8_013361 [Champsocephalus gunnari]|uniref:Uncharacterized protein n=1 Tax=Champsocephalus gunnari TaxID=52237 RepID=A0AAN8DS40_CHAGU|nr:hypothetical protein CgunFtcFv8_013361 [Champsocephalus gunnari]
MCSQCVPRVTTEGWLRFSGESVVLIGLGSQPESLMREAERLAARWLESWAQCTAWMQPLGITSSLWAVRATCTCVGVWLGHYSIGV